MILIRNPWFEGGTVQESRNIYSTSPYLNSVTKIDKISQRIDGKGLQMSSACLVHTPDQQAISCLVKDTTYKLLFFIAKLILQICDVIVVVIIVAA